MSINNDYESQNLETHVAANRMRFEHIDDNFRAVEDRLEKIENKVDSLQKEVSSSNSALIKAIVYSAGSIVAGLVSTIVVILVNF